MPQFRAGQEGIELDPVLQAELDSSLLQMFPQGSFADHGQAVGLIGESEGFDGCDRGLVVVQAAGVHQGQGPGSCGRLIAYLGVGQTDAPRDDGDAIGEPASGEAIDLAGEVGGRGDDRGAGGGDLVHGVVFRWAVLGRHHLWAVGDGDDRDSAGDSAEGQAECEPDVLGVDGVRPVLFDECPDLLGQFVNVVVEAGALGALCRGEGDQVIERGLPRLIDRCPAEEGRVSAGHGAVEVVDEDQAPGRRLGSAVDAGDDGQGFGAHAEIPLVDGRWAGSEHGAVVRGPAVVLRSW
ncbi:hypothetical protein OG516_37150 [Streptomyces murinus]|nr:hypothetical protein [Streptomyces murinus]WSI89789.1 hypothetical protein OG516_37150 [Streptomyces murinus]